VGIRGGAGAHHDVAAVRARARRALGAGADNEGDVPARAAGGPARADVVLARVAFGGGAGEREDPSRHARGAGVRGGDVDRATRGLRGVTRHEGHVAAVRRRGVARAPRDRTPEVRDSVHAECGTGRAEDVAAIAAVGGVHAGAVAAADVDRAARGVGVRGLARVHGDVAAVGALRGCPLGGLADLQGDVAARALRGVAREDVHRTGVARGGAARVDPHAARHARGTRVGRGDAHVARRRRTGVASHESDVATVRRGGVTAGNADVAAHIGGRVASEG